MFGFNDVLIIGVRFNEALLYSVNRRTQTFNHKKERERKKEVPHDVYTRGSVIHMYRLAGASFLPAFIDSSFTLYTSPRPLSKELSASFIVLNFPKRRHSPRALGFEHRGLVGCVQTCVLICIQNMNRIKNRNWIFNTQFWSWSRVYYKIGIV